MLSQEKCMWLGMAVNETKKDAGTGRKDKKGRWWEIERHIIFFDQTNGDRLTMPVTPQEYWIDHGVGSEVVRLTELGDINLLGKRYMMTITLDVMFPAQRYPFMLQAGKTDPWIYVQILERWCDNNTLLRMMIPGTNVNTTAKIAAIKLGEKDGTNDVYATLTIKQVRVLQPSTTAASSDTGNQSRAEEPQQAAASGGTDAASGKEQQYTVVSGDTLSAICRKFYGNANLYNQVASYNGIANPHLIFPGQVLKLPNQNKL